MTTATTEVTGDVERVHLSDGVLVRLAGALGEAQLPRLRRALLTPLARDCRDVVVDAAGLTAIDDCALAVLLAGRVWAEDNGTRFLLSGSAVPLDDCLAELDLADALPRLSSLTPHAPVVPLPRHSID